MAWIVRRLSLGAEGEEHSTDVLRIARPGDLASLGLTLGEGKRILAGVQQGIVAAQARVHAARRPECRSCGTVCRVKDYRQHGIATLFGQVTVRLPRFRCGGCGAIASGMEWPLHARSMALSRWRVIGGTKWVGQAGGMTSEPATYPGYRFPAEIISHAVWLYHVFSLSLRDVELILAEVRHRTGRYLNNRAESSHRPTRRRERQMQRFKSPEQAQRFPSSHAMICGHFRPRRHLMTAIEYRRARAKALSSYAGDRRV